MPTTRVRHVLTETDDVERAIDRAAPLFPGESRAGVLRRLIALGAAAIEESSEQHRRQVRERAGRHPDVYSSDELEQLRKDWPE